MVGTDAELAELVEGIDADVETELGLADVTELAGQEPMLSRLPEVPP